MPCGRPRLRSITGCPFDAKSTPLLFNLVRCVVNSNSPIVQREGSYFVRVNNARASTGLFCIMHCDCCPLHLPRLPGCSRQSCVTYDRLSPASVTSATGTEQHSKPVMFHRQLAPSNYPCCFLRSTLPIPQPPMIFERLRIGE